MKSLKTFVAHGQIKDGVHSFDNERHVKGMLSLFSNTKTRVVFEKPRGTRSKNMNNYYFGVVLPEISEHTGFLVEELHEIFKSKYLRSKRVWRGGDMTVLKSTSSLTTDEFGEYLSSVILEAGELGITIPEADKEYRVKRDFDLKVNVNKI